MNPLDLIAATRLPAGPEADVQAAIAAVLSGASIQFEREVRLSPAERIDFMVGELGIEVKIKGARRDIWRQLQRYAAFPAVGRLALVSSVAIGLPDSVAGKPLRLVSIGRAWL